MWGAVVPNLWVGGVVLYIVAATVDRVKPPVEGGV